MNSKNGCLAIILASILVALPIVSIHAAQRPDASLSPVVQSLMAKEKSSWTLAIKKNATAYKALHAKNFLTVSESGVVERAQSEASALDASVTFDRCTLSHMQVHWVNPDVALITYRVQFAGSDHGKKFAGDQYASSLWARYGNQWLNTFYQATPAANK